MKALVSLELPSTLYCSILNSDESKCGLLKHRSESATVASAFPTGVYAPRALSTKWKHVTKSLSTWANAPDCITLNLLLIFTSSKSVQIYFRGKLLLVLGGWKVLVLN